MLVSSLRRFAYLILVLFIGCKDSEPPGDYLRIAGTAPRLEDAPTARALLLVFWATWCAPCLEETPRILALARNPPDGLRVVVVSQDTEPDAVQELFGGPPDPALRLRFDPDRRLFHAFRVEALPVAFLVVGGELRARFEGSRQWDGKAQRPLLERLIAERLASPTE